MPLPHINCEIRERFAQANGPLIYQLRCEISYMTQKKMKVVNYYTKLKMLCDELMCLLLLPQPNRTYATTKEITDMMLSGQSMEFLMGLHDMFNLI